MKETILRYEECTSPPQPPDSTAFLWCAWLTPLNPPMALGRDAAQAEEILRDHLLHFYTHEIDPRVADPEARAAAELARQKESGLVWVVAPDERRAFETWHQMSSLVRDEALRLWRLAFPLPMNEIDPLGGRMRRPSASATPPPPIPGRARARGHTRRRVLLGQLLERLPHLDTGKIENLCRVADGIAG